MSSTVRSEVDQALARRLRNAIMTVQAWDDDPSLLQEIRLLLPWDELRHDNHSSKYAEYPQDTQRFPSNTNRNAHFVQRLARWFQRDFMTWVNAPPCEHCGNNKDMTLMTTRGPETEYEKTGGASRVEVYQCETCRSSNSTNGNATAAPTTTSTTFPRFNAPRTLLETRRGRCGEYANLFGCICRAVGSETRYILDVTDHVWTEVRVLGGAGGNGDSDDWLMVDSCEGVVNEPSMYEVGWGKQLCGMFGIAADHCIDVTWRYTRQAHNAEFIQRRRQTVASSEAVVQEIIRECNQQLQANLTSAKARQNLQQRLQQENKILSSYRQLEAWTHGQEYGQGRISGSLEWKVARQEAGTMKEDAKAENGAKTNNGDKESKVSAYSIETFFPLSSETVSIEVKPYASCSVNPRQGIVVSATPCAVGHGENTLSVVVVDETCLGCILQSRGFSTLQDFTAFVESIPSHRIVAVQGKVPAGDDKDGGDSKVGAASETSMLEMLPGFRLEWVQDGILYIGQKNIATGWTFCSSFQNCANGGHRIQLDRMKIPTRDLSLRTLKSVQPQGVLGRLRGDWSNASEAEKRQAFVSFKDVRCSGYTTKPGMPVYLLGESAFPLEKKNSTEENENDALNWNTFLWYPTPMVPESDHGIVDTSKVDSSFLYQVPLDLDFFRSLLGSTLQTKSGPKPTSSVLENTRLVGLYFSAHWCGPCRSFTPAFAEMYESLREAYPSHGLEIVYVSSDRDARSFENYYSQMPWAAIPFENIGMFKAHLSMRYGVRGIPFLVILDAVSGHIVVPGSSSRQEVMGACRRGDAAIEQMFQDWIDRIPAETKEIINMLEVSCNEDRVEESNKETSEEEAALDYLVNGSLSRRPLTFKSSPVATSEDWEMECLNRVLQHGSNTELCQVIETAIKYVENARKQPWQPKFRSFRLSNKVADRITRVPHGISFLESVGLEVVAMEADFVMTIPLDLDLDDLHEDLSAYLEEYSG